jgi:hypothetical protein
MLLCCKREAAYRLALLKAIPKGWSVHNALLLSPQVGPHKRGNRCEAFAVPTDLSVVPMCAKFPVTPNRGRRLEPHVPDRLGPERSSILAGARTVRDRADEGSRKRKLEIRPGRKLRTLGSRLPIGSISQTKASRRRGRAEWKTTRRPKNRTIIVERFTK